MERRMISPGFEDHAAQRKRPRIVKYKFRSIKLEEKRRKEINRINRPLGWVIFRKDRFSSRPRDKGTV